MMRLEIIFSVLALLIIFVLLPMQYNIRAKHNAELVKGVVTKEATTNLQNDVNKVVYVTTTKIITVKEIHEQNSVKLQQVEQSNVTLTDELITTINSGLCQYKTTTGCNPSKLF